MADTPLHRSPAPFGEGPWRVTDVYSIGPAGEQWACLRDATGSIIARLPWAQAIDVRRMLAATRPAPAASQPPVASLDGFRDIARIIDDLRDAEHNGVGSATIAQAVLTALAERYVLVPQKGPGARTHTIDWRLDSAGQPIGPEDPGGTLYRQVVAYGPWQPTPPAAPPLQADPDLLHNREGDHQALADARRRTAEEPLR